jgi:DNA gyrase subunit A
MENQTFDKIQEIEISQEMKSSYIDYAMSVIVARALPDVRDGLKPVQRRILYAMNELNLDPSKGYKKCARIVGDTMGKYHPHGDSSIYDALVRMAQDFNMRYMLVDGHGNFGSIDGFGAAASRYTEAKLQRISMEMLRDIDKDTVDFIDNYDGEFKEPTVLPSRIPNLLVNGSNGIAVGMATSIPPHNLTEVVDAIIKMIDNHILENRETEIDELMSIVKGPDFPTGAIIYGTAGIASAYRTGKGRLKLRAKAEIVTAANGRTEIIVSEIPYQVNKKKLIKQIADLVKDKRIEGISDINDYSQKDEIKIVIECKRDANAEIILNQLYKFSQLQETYSINFLSIVDGVPRILNLKEMLEYYLGYQEQIITRRTRFELKKAQARIHIVEGLVKALDNIDEVINIIRSSQTRPEAKERLIDRFEFTDIQADAICNMRLIALTGLERDRLLNELADLQAKIAEYELILSDENKLYEVIKGEITDIKTRFSDDRLTEIVQDMGEIDMEDLIEDEMSVITMTSLNYIKRIPLDTYKSQNRGGKGIIGMQTRDEDCVTSLFLSSNHDYILYFTNMGKVYRTKTWQIPEAGRNAKGTPVINVIDLDEGEKITQVMPVRELDENTSFIMVTKHGVIKKISADSFKNIRRGGLRAVNLRDEDDLIAVRRLDGNKDIFVATKFGMTIRFSQSDLRSLGRTAAGVRAINLNEGDEVIGAEVIEDGLKLLIVSEKGYGKCTDTASFRVQSRGGKGLKAYKITEKTGNAVGIAMVNDNEELMLVTSEGVIIRIRVKDISTVGRVAQGVKLINVDEGVTVMSIAKVSEDCVEEETENSKSAVDTADNSVPTDTETE